MDPQLSRLALLISILLGVGTCNYRQIDIRNADVCQQKKMGLPLSNNVLEIGEGAMIFQLRHPPASMQGNVRNRKKVCEIQIEAPDGHGIMAHVEQMRMRKNAKNGKCLDYMQFGRNDLIPFITVDKSKRYCGEVSSRRGDDGGGFGFHEPGGSLLVWIYLGGRSWTPNWPHINVVNLTLVVTSYRKSCGATRSGGAVGEFRSCDAKGDACIRYEYFCDRHSNCPNSSNGRGGPVSADEYGCLYWNDKANESTTGGKDLGEGGGGGIGGFSLDDMNIISWTMILACTCFLCAVVFAVVLVRVRSRRRRRRRRKCGYCCCLPDSNGGSSCEFPESHQLGVVELSARRQRMGPEAEQNLYVPLEGNAPSTTATTQTHRVRARTEPRRGAPPEEFQNLPEQDEDAPPAYSDLFPDGTPPTTVATSRESPTPTGALLPPAAAAGAAAETGDEDSSQGAAERLTTPPQAADAGSP